MAEGETHTVWDGFGPGENYHEAGAVPAYFLSAQVLGVQLAGPVSRLRLRIEPHLGDLKRAGRAEGVVVTELGPVPVRWRQAVEEGGLEVEVPPACRATLALPVVGGLPVVVVDGRTVGGRRPRMVGRHAVLELGPGVHHGRSTPQPFGR